MSNKINIRVEYESQPIRHCSIQCSNCGKRSWDYDCCENGINDSSNYEEMKKDCMTRKEVWE